jgi:RimJ/RimL family protein N-acetyltransferase
MTPTLQTGRLLLEPLRLEDATQVQQLFPQWEVVQYLAASFPWPYPPDGALTYYRDFALPAVARGEEWHWTLRLKSAPEVIIGAIGLMRDPAIPDATHGNRGFWLAPEHHNHGLMTEAVIAANDYWFDTLGFETLRVGKAVGNATSRRISEKTGMRLVGTGEKDYICGRLPSEIWLITREEWHAWRMRHPLTA